MKILVFIISIFLGSIFYTWMKTIGVSPDHDTFSWGFFTGVIVMFVNRLFLDITEDK